MRNKARMCAVTCPIRHHTRGPSQCNETRKQKANRWKIYYIKLSLLTDKTVYTENLNESTKLPKLISEFNKVDDSSIQNINSPM